jgi:hypothetical protein
VTWPFTYSMSTTRSRRMAAQRMTSACLRPSRQVTWRTTHPRGSSTSTQLPGLVDRFTGTWGNQQAFGQDLIAYFFRSAPHLRRLDHLHPQLLELTHELTLGDWVFQAGRMEMNSIKASPLIPLHNLMASAQEGNPVVVAGVHRLRLLRLRRWARLYEQVFPAYGAPLRDRPDVDWMAVAERFSTIANGVFTRAQTRPGGWTADIDGEFLAQMVVDQLPSLMKIDWGDISSRRRID